MDFNFKNENIDLAVDGIEFIDRKKFIPIFITPFEKVTYWSDWKRKLEEEGFGQLYDIIVQLKLKNVRSKFSMEGIE